MRKLYAAIVVALSILFFVPSAHSIDRLQWTSLDVTVGNGAAVSAAFAVPSGALYVYAIIPAMDDGAIGLAMTNDNTSTYYPVLDPLSGTDAVVCASGSDPGAVDISTFCVIPHNDEIPNAKLYYLRFTCAAQVSGAVTITLYFGG